MALPAQHVAESWNSAEFFANKLLREFRGVNEAQVAWVQALKVRLQQHMVLTNGGNTSK
jgi:adenylyl cyclase-associated protein